MTAPGSTTLVVGATGNTGGRVAARLVAGGHHVKAASRSATPVDGARPVRFDWNDPASFENALEDVDRVYLVPPPGSLDPAATMLPFLRRARAAGVDRAVLLSSSAIPVGGPATGKVHQVLPDLFAQWAVLRPSWFMQNFTGDHVHAQSIRTDGTIRTAADDGRVGFVDADDIAAVAVHSLVEPRAPNTDLVITGPRPLSYDDVAAILTQVGGRTVTHRRLTPERMRDHLTDHVPAEFAAMLTDLDRAIAHGAEDRTTDTVKRVTGRSPRDFRSFAQRELT